MLSSSSTSKMREPRLASAGFADFEDRPAACGRAEVRPRLGRTPTASSVRMARPTRAPRTSSRVSRAPRQARSQAGVDPSREVAFMFMSATASPSSCRGLHTDRLRQHIGHNWGRASAAGGRTSSPSTTPSSAGRKKRGSSPKPIANEAAATPRRERLPSADRGCRTRLPRDNTARAGSLAAHGRARAGCGNSLQGTLVGSRPTARPHLRQGEGRCHKRYRFRQTIPGR